MLEVGPPNTEAKKKCGFVVSQSGFKTDLGPHTYVTYSSQLIANQHFCGTVAPQQR